MNSSRSLRPELPIGTRGTASMHVEPTHLASAFAEDIGEAYPAVLSTPALIGLLERACAATLKPLLGAGEMSVGVRVDVSHTAPTALGGHVVASATLLRRDGRLYVFEVSATDAGGVVAKGEHSRAIVRSADVEKTAASRAGVPQESAR